MSHEENNPISKENKNDSHFCVFNQNAFDSLINDSVIYVDSHIHAWLTGFIANDCLCFSYVLMFMYYTVCYFTGLFYAVVRQISMLFIDNKDSVLFNFLILHSQLICMTGITSTTPTTSLTMEDSEP